MYKGTVTVAATGAANTPVTVPVTLTLGSNTLTVAPTSMSFAYQIACTAPLAQNLTVDTTNGALGFTAVAGAPWLSVTPASGTTLATLSVSVKTAWPRELTRALSPLPPPEQPTVRLTFRLPLRSRPSRP